MLRFKKSTRKKRPTDSLPRELIRVLGTRPDAQLAEQFQIDVTIVRRERLLRGVSRLGRYATWKESEIPLLGTMSDAALASRLGKAPHAVRMQRRKRNIAARGLPNEKTRHRWTARQLAWLGKLSDKMIAERVGLDPTTVRFKRESLGIQPTKKGRRGHEWTKQELALLGKLPDAELARKIGIHRRRVALKRQQLGLENPIEKANARRWTPERIAKLGQVSDDVVAKEMGLSRATVSAYRFRHGILRRPRRRTTTPKPGWSASAVNRLGRVPDPEIAAELGITRAAVAIMRQRLGIASHRANQLAATVSTVSSTAKSRSRKVLNSSSLQQIPEVKVAANRSRQAKKAVVK